MHECHDNFRSITFSIAPSWFRHETSFLLPLVAPSSSTWSLLPPPLGRSFLLHLVAPSSSTWSLLPFAFKSLPLLCLAASLFTLDRSCLFYITLPSTSHHYFMFLISFHSIYCPSSRSQRGSLRSVLPILDHGTKVQTNCHNRHCPCSMLSSTMLTILPVC
jgi:hypothetical protein